MQILKDNASGCLDFKTNRPVSVAPAIVREYYTKTGERMYECEGKRVFIADTYDRVFVAKKKKVKPLNHIDHVNEGKRFDRY